MKALIGVGVPGCGKTTYLKPLADQLGYAYISPDDIRQEITGDTADHTQELDVWKETYRRIAKALQSSGVVVDATFTKKRDRKKMIEHCKASGARQIIAYWFDVPFKTCEKRNEQRERVVPRVVLDKMYNRLQLNPPTVEEGFDEVVSLPGGEYESLSRISE